MSDFVDYTKRSVDLPPGCTDLVDVLKLAPKPQKKGWGQIVTEDGGLANVEAMLYRLLQSQSQAKHNLLLITVLPSSVPAFCVSPISGGVELLLTRTASTEKAILEFFASPTLPRLVAAGTTLFKCPLCEPPPEAAELIRKVLTKIYACPVDGRLRFMFI